MYEYINKFKYIYIFIQIYIYIYIYMYIYIYINISLFILYPKIYIYFYRKFNPADSTFHDIQKIVKKTMLTKNENCPTQPNIENRAGQPMYIDRLVVAYWKQKNIINLVFPRKFDSSAGPQISHYIDDEKI